MTETLETGAVDTQQFAAPGRTIAAETDAIQRQRQLAALQTVFREHGRGVPVMVLHAQQRQAALLGEIGGKTCRVEIRVQVVRHDRRFDAEEFHQLRDAFIEKIANGSVVEVANVLRNECLIAAGDTDRVLEPGTHGQYRGS